MGSDASSENSEGEQEQLPHPPSEVVEDVFSLMIDSMPRTKEEVMNWCNDDDDDGEEEHDVHRKVQKLPKTAKEIYNRCKILHCQWKI